MMDSEIATELMLIAVFSLGLFAIEALRAYAEKVTIVLGVVATVLAVGVLLKVDAKLTSALPCQWCPPK